ncbi:hypothetical protein ACFL1E_07780, partial [Candidatus Omnitrophota bacterium]
SEFNQKLAQINEQRAAVEAKGKVAEGESTSPAEQELATVNDQIYTLSTQADSVVSQTIKGTGEATIGGTKDQVVETIASNFSSVVNAVDKQIAEHSEPVPVRYGGWETYTVDRNILRSAPLQYARDGIKGYLSQKAEPDAAQEGKGALERGTTQMVVSTYNRSAHGIPLGIKTYGNKQVLSLSGAQASLRDELKQFGIANGGLVVEDFDEANLSQEQREAIEPYKKAVKTYSDYNARLSEKKQKGQSVTKAEQEQKNTLEKNMQELAAALGPQAVRIKTIAHIEQLREKDSYMKHFTYIPGEGAAHKQKVIGALREVRQGRTVFSPESNLLNHTERDVVGRPTKTSYYGFEYNAETGEWEHAKIDRTTEFYNGPFGVALIVDKDYTYVSLPEQWPTETETVTETVQEGKVEEVTNSFLNALVNNSQRRDEISKQLRTGEYGIIEKTQEFIGEFLSKPADERKAQTQTLYRAIKEKREENGEKDGRGQYVKPDLSDATPSDIFALHAMAKWKFEGGKSFDELSWEDQKQILWDITGWRKATAQRYAQDGVPQQWGENGIESVPANRQSEADPGYPSPDTTNYDSGKQYARGAAPDQMNVDDMENLYIPGTNTVEKETEIVKQGEYSTGPNTTYDMNLYETGKGHSPWTGPTAKVVARDINSGPLLQGGVHYRMPSSTLNIARFQFTEAVTTMGNLQREEKEDSPEMQEAIKALKELQFTNEQIEGFKSALSKESFETFAGQSRTKGEASPQGAQPEEQLVAEWVRQSVANAAQTVAPELNTFLDEREQEIQQNVESNLASMQEVLFFSNEQLAGDTGKTYAMPTWSVKIGNNQDDSVRFDNVRSYQYDRPTVTGMVNTARSNAETTGNVQQQDFLDGIGVYRVEGTDKHLVKEDIADSNFRAAYKFRTNIHLPGASDQSYENMGVSEAPVIPLSDVVEGHADVSPIDLGAAPATDAEMPRVSSSPPPASPVTSTDAARVEAPAPTGQSAAPQEVQAPSEVRSEPTAKVLPETPEAPAKEVLEKRAPAGMSMVSTGILRTETDTMDFLVDPDRIREARTTAEPDNTSVYDPREPIDIEDTSERFSFPFAESRGEATSEPGKQESVSLFDASTSLSEINIEFNTAAEESVRQRAIEIEGALDASEPLDAATPVDDRAPKAQPVVPKEVTDFTTEINITAPDSTSAVPTTPSIPLFNVPLPMGPMGSAESDSPREFTDASADPQSSQAEETIETVGDLRVGQEVMVPYADGLFERPGEVISVSRTTMPTLEDWGVGRASYAEIEVSLPEYAYSPEGSENSANFHADTLRVNRRIDTPLEEADFNVVPPTDSPEHISGDADTTGVTEISSAPKGDFKLEISMAPQPPEVAPIEFNTTAPDSFIPAPVRDISAPADPRTSEFAAPADAETTRASTPAATQPAIEIARAEAVDNSFLSTETPVTQSPATAPQTDTAINTGITKLEIASTPEPTTFERIQNLYQADEATTAAPRPEVAESFNLEFDITPETPQP